MKDLVKDLMETVGISGQMFPDENAIGFFESWLGLPGCRHPVGKTMEESVPLGSAFFVSLVTLLVKTWDPNNDSTGGNSGGTNYPRNLLLDYEYECQDPQELTLAKAIPAVRVTRWLRHMMDLNIMGGVAQQHSAESVTVLHLLLEHNTTTDGATMNDIPLLQALYFHISSLPSLQSQIHLYTQVLMRGVNQHTSGKPLASPGSRLQHYQQTQQISDKLMKEWDDHVTRLEILVGEFYSIGSPAVRRQCKSHLGLVWSRFVAAAATGGGVRLENTSASGIRMTLRVLHRILLGMRSRPGRPHYHLLFHHLLPLHQPNSMVLWRDQTSLLDLYHEPLVQCVAVLLQKQPDWIPACILAILQPEIWPAGGNTPKLVLLLHEIDTYVGLLPDGEGLGETLVPLLNTLGRCMASDHSRLAERALTFFKNKKFKALVENQLDQALPILLPSLVRTEPSWNPTVRKMTYHVLKGLQNSDEDKFAAICGRQGSSHKPPQEKQVPQSPPKKQEVPAGAARPTPRASQTPDFSLKAGMGGWKPPPASRNRSGAMLPPAARPPRAAPPVTVTGVAPWAMSSNKNASSANPPLTITGVAPWAVQRPSHKRRAGEAQLVSGREPPMETLSEEESRNPGLARVLRYMEQLKPPEEEEGVSSWARVQMAETPTLLPNLKFHDLVFGHDLGKGAFGAVKYARLIDRNATRSQWPEYAVKIIPTELIKELGYETSVKREIAVLRILSHPGIARLISSFRFGDGAYLVLEYASGGDLHMLLRKHGSLNNDSTRFVMGEVVAALASIHDMGFVYGDLKPENIVITEQGHIKLTDFGACRPITPEAKEMIEETARNALRDLRSGDWKPVSKEDETSISHEPGHLEEDLEDSRVEGTTAYLPPEVVLGGIPSISSDSWACGCVIYQCLSGRPPILEADETMTRNKIVSFDVKESIEDGHVLFRDKHAASIQEDARDIIQALLNRSPALRPTMHQIATHDFFLKGEIDVFSLYKQTPQPLDVGDVSPVADAQWSRRQFSSIWAPQPQSYDISMPDDNEPETGFGALKSGPIVEGEEATSFFSRTSHTPVQLGHISETKPLS